MQIKSSREIAEAMMKRAGIKTPPFAVDLPPVVCSDCGGDGTVENIVGGWDVPIWKTHKCKMCHGVGEVQLKCEACGTESASVLLNMGCPSMSKFCAACAEDTTNLDGIDLAVSIALRVLP